MALSLHFHLNVFLSSSQQHPLYVPERCCGFQCDLTSDDLRHSVPEGGVDVVTLIFVLSAVHPDKMKLVLQNISRVRRLRGLQLPCTTGASGFLRWCDPKCVSSQVLKPGGSVLFRDYGLHDHAMLRFKAGSKLGENFYVRQDGTRSFFFSKGQRSGNVKKTH